jgi:hypothetical protein
MRRSIRERPRCHEQQRRVGSAGERSERRWFCCGWSDSSDGPDTRPGMSDRRTVTLRRDVRRPEDRSDALWKLLHDVRWRHAGMQCRHLRRDLHSRPHELQQCLHRHEEQPEPLRWVWKGLRRRSAMLERYLHVSRRHDALQWEVRGPHERPSELWRVRNGLLGRHAGLQRWQVRRDVRDGSRAVWECVHRHEGRREELRSMRRRLSQCADVLGWDVRV